MFDLQMKTYVNQCNTNSNKHTLQLKQIFWKHYSWRLAARRKQRNNSQPKIIPQSHKMPNNIVKRAKFTWNYFLLSLMILIK
jgi:hypothetical protein